MASCFAISAANNAAASVALALRVLLSIHPRSADVRFNARADASTGLLDGADTCWRPLVCIVIRMLASGVISRCPRCRLSTRNTLALRDPVSKVRSVLDAVLHL